VIKIKNNISLAQFTTFGIGGSAQFFTTVENSGQLESALKWALENQVKVSILGGGTNLLISDKGIKGLVIRLHGVDLELKDTKVSCFSGLAMHLLVKKTTELGLSGLEFFAGLPGTVGGAIYKNSHWREHSVSDNLQTVEVYDLFANKRILFKKDLDFSYDWSNFQKDSLVIAKLTFNLKHADRKMINKTALEVLRIRNNHPQGKSAGCIFKNVNNQSAGKIIEKAGFSGEKLGDIEISPKHANFFINVGQGKSADVYKLIRKVQKKLKLEPEIFFWGDFDE
jgi:UDP-N-acetylmuramate dehydrogenase